MTEPQPELHGDEIAIVGMVCRLPGAADVERFWHNLRDGVESISFFSDEELLEAGVDPALLRKSSYVRSAGGLIEGIDLFDAAFFGLTPREAEVLDPQHRLFVEAAHEALERAGHDPATHRGAIGVFAGAGRPVYLLDNLLAHPRLLTNVGAVAVTLGTDKDFVPLRVSYALDLKGPSVNVQSACSTSLVATHLACQSLIAGECDLALAGGVSITTLRPTGYLWEEGGVYSPDGHCRAFDAKAKGMVGANGLAIVVLRRLEDAMRDGDHVHAIVRGSAVGNDGAYKVGFTAPGVDGQARVIRDALAVAGVEARSIGYVEAHGTGTALGDPIEVEALTQVFREQTPDVGFCTLGSVKTNIGHSNAAAGCAGLIKTALALEHAALPATLHFEQPNPEIDLPHSPFVVRGETVPWPRTAGTPRRAGVSSFGMGGTNAHVVLEQAPALAPGDPDPGPQVLVISAKNHDALEAATDRLAAQLRAEPELVLADAAFTLQVGRTAYRHRRAVVASDAASAARALSERDRVALAGDVAPSGGRRVAFLLSGQGAQYPDMARGLYDEQPVFRAELDACAETLRPHLGLDLRTVLFPAGDPAEASKPLQQTWLTQPALFAVEYALARLWQSLGVEPAALAGHSIGEWVAACLAGVIARDDALALVAARGRLMQDLPAGSMLSVPLSEDEVNDVLPDGLDLAAVNAPKLCVVSGPTEAIEALRATLAARDVPARVLRTSHAFHSAMMDPIVATFEQRVAAVTLRRATIPIVSTVTGTWIEPDDWADPRYWARNLREPVRFAAAAATLLKDDRALLEVGPGNTLVTLARQHGTAAKGRPIVASLRHPQATQSDGAFLLSAIGTLWSGGVGVDWHALHGGRRRRRVVLPTYPFQRRRFWVEAGTPAIAATPPARVRHTDVSKWIWVPSWRRTPPPPRDERVEGPWLVFTDAAGLATRAGKNLPGDAVIVRAGEAFEQLDNDRFTVRPGERDDYVTLLAAMAADGRTPRRVLHAWGLVDREAPACTLESLPVAEDRSFWSLLSLTQAFAERHPGKPLHLDVLVDDLHEVVGGEAGAPVRALSLGAVRVLPMEHDGWTARLIDVSIGDAERAVAQVVEECRTAVVDSVVAWRGRYRWTPAFEASPLGEPDEPTARDGGVYLITGGLGGVGLVLAEALAATAKVKLALTSTRGLPPREEWEAHLRDQPDERVAERIRAVQALEERGAEVLVLAADVSDFKAMRRAVAQVRDQLGALDGVVHAAGRATGGLAVLRGDEAKDVLDPKVKGTLALSAAVAGEPLDWFVLCSSLASVMGGVGAIDYCAANAFLDAVAVSRDVGDSVPFVSIAWDTWREVGMAAETPVPEELRKEREAFLAMGIGNAEGRDVFARVLGSPLRQVLISTRDLPLRLTTTSRTAAAAATPGGLLATPPAAAQSEARSTPRTSDAAPAGEPMTDTEQRIAAIWREQLGVDQVGRDDDFFELGGHSLAGTRVAARLKEAFAVDLPLRQFFESPTVAALAQWIESARAADDREHLEI